MNVCPQEERLAPEWAQVACVYERLHCAPLTLQDYCAHIAGVRLALALYRGPVGPDDIAVALWRRLKPRPRHQQSAKQQGWRARPEVRFAPEECGLDAAVPRAHGLRCASGRQAEEEALVAAATLRCARPSVRPTVGGAP